MKSVLAGWKEIAEYFGKCVRTVQRWERDMGLPVHRPNPKLRGSVIAYPGGLDVWLRGGQTKGVIRHPPERD